MDRTCRGLRPSHFLAVVTAALACLVHAAGATVVPTADPGGFDIDGDLQANTPTMNVSDWLPQGSGSGTGALDGTGAPVYPIRTFHLIDAFNSLDDNFQSGTVLSSNPNVSWHWVSTSVVPSRNFNHALVYVVPDAANGHQWLLIAVDRQSASQSAVESVELMQGTLVVNADGTFTSSGAQGGRTVGDIALTWVVDPSAQSLGAARWIETSPGVFNFSPIASLPPSQYAVAMNTTKTVDVPYGAFGSNTYPVAQFAEMAIDLDAVLGAPPVTFQTLFITNRSSVSLNAVLGDFITPLHLNLPVAAVESSVSGLALRLASSNPTSGRVRFEMALPTETRVDLRVFDIHGREVERLASGTFSYGRHFISWDPRGSGRPAGVYFARLKAAGATVVRRITIAR